MFHDYLALYREAALGTRYAELPALQPAPFASLAHGGAGTAYALWRLGETRRARAWITAAFEDRKATALDPEAKREGHNRSLMFGKPGIRWVRAMITPTFAADYAKAITVAELDEHTFGRAGHLTAAVALLRRSPDAKLARVADALGERLVEVVRIRAEASWQAADATGFAHGWPGICFAVLAWLEPRKERPAWLVGALARLAEAWQPGGVAERFEASWCNGAAGSLLLWTKAFAYSGEVRFLEIARLAARTAIEKSGKTLGVCCGDTGVAFALLALDRIDARGGWRTAARTLAAREIGNAVYVYPNGLYHGHPGLACLALDLVDEPRGFPAIEG